MAGDFYDPLVETAGQLAEEYSISVSGVLGLLLAAGRNEGIVRQALDRSLEAEGAGAMIALDRQFDLIEHARTLLSGIMSEKGDASTKD